MTTVPETLCPVSKTKGKPVKRVTLAALLKDEFVAEVGDQPYRFCDAKGCDVVYFTDGLTFGKSQLRVSLGVKESSGERPLCYCFGHSVATIKDELRIKGKSEALDDIRRKIKDPGCRCEVTNPSGTCCLGDVGRGIEVAESEIQQGEPPTGRLGAITRLGAVLAAMLASSCCWLPLALLAFGVSGAGVAGAMEAYRPAFIALTCGFLAAAFYLTYRPRKAVPSAESGCGPSHDCCVTEGQGRLRNSTPLAASKVMLWAATTFAIAFMCFPKYVGTLASWRGTSDVSGRADTTATTTTVFAVEGMNCAGCSVSVAAAVKGVPGVLDAQVDYAKKRATVKTEACCPLRSEAVLRTLKEAGYGGRVVADE